MLDLSKRVVLVGMGSTKVVETIKALEFCLEQCDFYDTLLLTDHEVLKNSKIRHIPISNIPSYTAYQKFVVNYLPDIILKNIPNTFIGHFLFINWDGFIVNPSRWTDMFLIYDYIGAPWPWMNHAVGNGGFCLKSRKFIEVQKNICKDYSVKENEDLELSIFLRRQFEANGCIYADSETGYAFSTENGIYSNYNSFGFHDFRLQPRFRKMIK